MESKCEQQTLDYPTLRQARREEEKEEEEAWLTVAMAMDGAQAWPLTLTCSESVQKFPQSANLRLRRRRLLAL